MWGSNKDVGIIVSEIPNMKTKIEAYIEGVDQVLNDLNANANYQQAYKGKGLESGAKNYVVEAINEIKKITQAFEKFSNDLDIIQKNYESHDTSASGQLKAATADLAGKKVTADTGVQPFAD